MDGTDLHRGRHWLEPIGMLPSPLELHLSDCQLDSNMTSSLGYANFSSLTFLDLSYNSTNQELPNWLFNLSSLAFSNIENISIFLSIQGANSKVLGAIQISRIS